MLGWKEDRWQLTGSFQPDELISSGIFPEPSWLLFTEMIDEKVADHALLLANLHRDNVEALEDVRMKMSYFQEAQDAAAKLDAEDEE